LEGHASSKPVSTMTRATDSAGHLSFLRSGAINWFRENTGTVKEKVLPFSGWLLTQISPPCRATSCLQIYKPSPRPLRLACVWPDTWYRRSKILSVISGLMPHPVSVTSRSNK